MTKPRNKDFNYICGKKYDGMMGRCYRESDKAFPRYGGRGIRVSSEWIRNIDTFRSWVREALFSADISEETFVNKSSEIQLDRIDSDGPYSASNCRLASPQQNARNKKNVKRIVVSAEGEEIEL